MNDRLDKIKKFYKKHRRLHSYSEMLNIFNLASKNAVFKIIQKLIEAGFIKKEGAKIAPASKFFALPLVGLVKAGFPILSQENTDYLTLDDYLIGDQQT